MLNSVVKVDQIVSHTEEAGFQARIKHKTRYVTRYANLISHPNK